METCWLVDLHRALLIAQVRLYRVAVAVAAVITTYLSCDKGPSINARSFKSDGLDKALRSVLQLQLASRQLLIDRLRPLRRLFVRASTIQLAIDATTLS